MVVTIISMLIAITLMSVDRYQNKASDTAIGANLSQIRKVVAMIYTEENSYAPVCDKSDDTLKDTSEDYPEPKIIEDGVMRLNDNKDVKCFVKKNVFCVYSPLSSDENRYFCVDSTGFAGEIDEDAAVCSDATIKCK